MRGRPHLIAVLLVLLLHRAPRASALEGAIALHEHGVWTVEELPSAGGAIPDAAPPTTVLQLVTNQTGSDPLYR